MISIIADTPEELQKVFEIMRSNDTQIHVDTVAQTAKSMATEPKFKVGMNARVITEFHPYFTKGEEVKIVSACDNHDVWMCRDGNGVCSALACELEPISPLDSNPYTR